MTERPILMSAPMVRALLAGTKTQTRRIAKPVKHPDLGNLYDPGVLGREPKHVIERACPYGQPGDRLWVRETWGVGSRPDPWGGFDGIEYRADVALLQDDIELLPCYKVVTPDDVCLGDYRSGWRPSIHMPRWASRITLEITEVRVQRLQEISEEDAKAEGLSFVADGCARFGVEGLASSWCDCPVTAYAALWESINGPGSWDANPYVWVISFKRITT